MVKQFFSAFVAGTIFGFGLSLSSMINPAVVVGFADVTGTWDPQLLFVMAGALSVTAICFPLISRRCKQPVCDRQFFIPEKRVIDLPLLLGAVLFGIGWGLGGVCPGPAVAALAFGMKETVIFLLAMLAGMFIFDRAQKNSK